MSDQSTLGIGIAMAEQPGRPLPTTTMQLAGHATGAVVEGLTASNKAPWMLGVVILNLCGIVAAVYFLNVLIVGQQKHLEALLALQQTQTTEILTMHKWEFDQLMGLAAREPAQTASTPQPPPPFPVRRSN